MTFLMGEQRKRCMVALALVGLCACGSSELVTGVDRDFNPSTGAGDTDAAAPDQGPGAEGPGHSAPDAASEGCATFENSFDAIQELVFERRGCTASACHGEAALGGLDLRADVAWENLVDANSANSVFARVQPGTAAESYLYLKLLAATEPGSVDISGSPMPVGTAPLTPDELQAVQLWILKGAPKVGVVADQVSGLDVGGLLDACLPAAAPVKTKPLEPPAPDEGIQIVLPRYVLEAKSEVEICTPFAYDFRDQVPAQFKDVARNVMYTNGSRVRQDPQSHHMVIWNPTQGLSSASPTDPDWTCRGGPTEGKQCDASKGSADCGTGGVCAGKATPGTLCGFDTSALGVSGPLTLEALLQLFGVLAAGVPSQVANSQSPQQYTPPLEGVYTEIPLSGILWFNSHAFNLTEEDTVLEARVNYYYAKELRREMRPVNVIDANGIADGQAPFTRKTYCAKHVVPRNYSLAIMTGHTHRRGERFWVTDPEGATIYENFDYNDPDYKNFKPWREFNSIDEASRTLEYCATFNNGLKADDSPDLDLVTRASRMPDRTDCTPVACVAGKIQAACKTHRDCDSAPGANDGDCDACPITAGQTTENEMFVLMPWYVLPPK